MYWIKWVLSIIFSTFKHGINLYSMLDALYRIHPDKIAFVIDENTFSFKSLKQISDRLIVQYKNQDMPDKVGLMLENEINAIAALFALSRLGKHIVILNRNLVEHKLQALIQQQQLFIICSKNHKLNLVQNQFILINPSQQTTSTFQLKAKSFNKISVCSSGSTGIPKIATRNSKPWQAIALIDLMLRQLKFYKIKKLFVMTPICHAAGLTASLLSFCFAKTVILQSRFEANSACILINQYQIDSLNLVPTILYRLLTFNSPLNHVKYIVSGSAPLSEKLYLKMIQHHPDIQLFNLYGSSETGINIIAKPHDLAIDPRSIGKAIKGVKIKIIDQQGQPLKHNQIGVLWTKCAWSITPNQWMQCGDLAYQNPQGYIYLKGRQDHMLICGGINIYPIDLENILLKHPMIENAQAYAIDDIELGQCLAVNIIVNSPIEIEEIQQWLIPQIPRYLRPKAINIVTEIKTDSVGKPIL